MTSDEIRDTWLRFFSEKGHHIEPSASLIPNNDPTLLWINAGVAALKKYFDGTLTPKYRRLTNAQKCIRTNDIDNVGHTARHHTFFEMLGNFSIGDYFRHEIIPWAVELLTSNAYFGIPKEKLYITYYPDDIDTYETWIKAGISKDHLIPCKSNFWEIGEGPCGPDTEINFDRGEKYDPEHLGLKLLEDDLENDRYIELWNIVFSQYNAKSGVDRKDYKQLPQKNIDTGAGLERFACIFQETETNFETDLFYPYIQFLEKKAKYPYDEEHKLAYRVIADHIRSITFALADGALFSNDGRGYVLKRLLRRAERYANQIGLSTGVLAKLVPLVSENMAHFYPYLKEHEERSMKMILSEEKKFASTLKSGEKVLASYLVSCKDMLPGDAVFKLSDTYGFPYELTLEIASEAGKKVDEEGYLKCLEEAKEKSRKARGERESFASQSQDFLEFDTPSEFIYEDGDIKGKVTGLFIDGKKVDSIEDEGDVVFDKTNFYAESGGQVADTGYLIKEGCEARVDYVGKITHGQHLLHVKVLYGEIKTGDVFTQKVDWNRRDLIRKNHTATHLLQKALQELVSTDIGQEGAYYDDELLRLDISYNGKISPDLLSQVEKRVNEKIEENIEVKTEVLPKEEALKKNAMHLFNEKYGDLVRVVEIGDYSLEFCGGTHVSKTGEISLFVIVSESAISAGIRRIIAYTGLRAYDYLKTKQNELNEIAGLLKLTSDKGLRAKVIALNSQIEALNTEIKKLQQESTSHLEADLEKEIKHEGQYSFLAKVINTKLNHQQEEGLARKLIDRNEDLLLFLVVDNGEKKDIIVGRGKKLSIKAGKLLKEIAPILNGSGGGRDDLAFGGCKDSSAFNQAKQALLDNIKE